MRTRLTSVTALAVSALTATTAQGQTRIGPYKWQQAVYMYPADYLGTRLQDGAGTDLPPVVSLPDQDFRVIEVTQTSMAVLQVIDYTVNTTSGTRQYQPTPDFYKYNFQGTAADYAAFSDQDANARNYGNRQRYFTVPVAYLDDHAAKQTKVKGALTAGIVNFPFRYRPQKNKGDFSGAFNFGAGIGYTFPHKVSRQFAYSVLSGYSISNTILDASSTNKNQANLSTTNNYTAFSFSLGFLAEYQRVQAGVFLGWDKLSRINQTQYDWQYQGKPWFSVGFGFSIFSTQTEGNTTNTTPASQNGG